LHFCATALDNLRRVPQCFPMRCFLAVLALMLVTRFSTAAPTTAPAPDATTPMGLLRLSDSLAGAGPEAYLPLYYAADDDQRRLAGFESKLDAQFGLLQVMLEKKWGTSAAIEICHALGNLSAADVKSGGVQIDGDHATVTWNSDSVYPPLDLVRVEGQWKFDLAAELRTYKETADECIDGYRRGSQNVADFATDVDAGKFTSAADATAQAKKRFADLWGSTN
jgi:hypothetical protein